MDPDTFLTTFYVVDDGYKVEVGQREHVGARERMNDSEVLTVALAGRGGAVDAGAPAGLVSKDGRTQ